MSPLLLGGRIAPIPDGALVDTSLTPGALKPRGLSGLLDSNSFAVRTGKEDRKGKMIHFSMRKRCDHIQEIKSRQSIIQYRFR